MSGAAGACGAPAGGRRPRRSPRPRSVTIADAGAAWRPRDEVGLPARCGRRSAGCREAPAAGHRRPSRGGPSERPRAPRPRRPRAVRSDGPRAAPPSGRCSRGAGGAEPGGADSPAGEPGLVRRRIGRAVASAAAAPPPPSRTRGRRRFGRRVRERRVRHVCDRCVRDVRVSERHVGVRRVPASRRVASGAAAGGASAGSATTGGTAPGSSGSIGLRLAHWLRRNDRTGARARRSCYIGRMLAPAEDAEVRAVAAPDRDAAHGSRAKAFCCAPPRCRCCPRISRARCWCTSTSTSSTRSSRWRATDPYEGQRLAVFLIVTTVILSANALSQRALVRAAGALAPASPRGRRPGGGAGDDPPPRPERAARQHRAHASRVDASRALLPRLPAGGRGARSRRGRSHHRRA